MSPWHVKCVSPARLCYGRQFNQFSISLKAKNIRLLCSSPQNSHRLISLSLEISTLIYPAGFLLPILSRNAIKIGHFKRGRGDLLAHPLITASMNILYTDPLRLPWICNYLTATIHVKGISGIQETCKFTCLSSCHNHGAHKVYCSLVKLLSNSMNWMKAPQYNRCYL